MAVLSAMLFFLVPAQAQIGSGWTQITPTERLEYESSDVFFKISPPPASFATGTAPRHPICLCHFFWFRFQDKEKSLRRIDDGKNCGLERGGKLRPSSDNLCQLRTGRDF